MIDSVLERSNPELQMMKSLDIVDTVEKYTLYFDPRYCDEESMAISLMDNGIESQHHDLVFNVRAGKLSLILREMEPGNNQVKDKFVINYWYDGSRLVHHQGFKHRKDGKYRARLVLDYREILEEDSYFQRSCVSEIAIPLEELKELVRRLDVLYNNVIEAAKQQVEGFGND